MRTLLILFIVNFFFLSSRADTNFYLSDTLCIMQIKNEKLFPILDSIIMYEKDCEYYNPKLLFSIQCRNVNDTIIMLQIGAFGSIIPKLNRDKGCFEFGGHLFFVRGDAYNSIFENTNRKRHINYYIPEKNVVLEEDDTYSIWIYRYYKNDFKLIALWENFCKSLLVVNSCFP